MTLTERRVLSHTARTPCCHERSRFPRELSVADVLTRKCRGCGKRYVVTVRPSEYFATALIAVWEAQ